MSDELNRYYGWINPQMEPAKTTNAVLYLADLVGYVEVFRLELESMIVSTQVCDTVLYVVGSRIMDTSGLGNIVFGFHCTMYNIPYPNMIGSIDQFFHPQTLGQRYDNFDDASEIDTGELIALVVGQGQPIDTVLIEWAASEIPLN